MKKTILMTGGGTGGHILPLIPIAKRLSKRYKVVFVGQRKGMEEEIIGESDIEFEGINCAKIQGLSFLNPMTWINQCRGIDQSLKLIGKHQPELVVAKGGYVSFPVAIAAYIKNIKLVVHESDSVMGRTNRILSRIALRILTGFPKEYYSKKFQSKIIRVGIPVRSNFKPSDFPNHYQVLFMGGSQGSVFINNLVKKILPAVSSKAKIVHICGKENLGAMEKYYDTLDDSIKSNYQILSFTDKIAQHLQDSSLVVSRAGATSIAELANIKRPALFVPFPHAAAGHQQKNAKIIKSKGAGEVVLESRSAHKQVQKKILDLLDDLDKRHELADGLNHFMALDSVNMMQKIIVSLIE
jgi:UDP-N-acetylglucosamine--N-acetylmuramyl-(pentapeptide) pyrophosphoryl-undecaprenol N-acetylglucosamine transferase